MNRFSFLIIVSFLSLLIYVFLFPYVWKNREIVRHETPAGYVIPSKFSKILSLGNQGVLSDFLFLKTSTFIGGRSEAKFAMKDGDWEFVVRSLDVVTDLDPYFVDPYVLAEGLLAWDAGRPKIANKLLEKGMKYRIQDWRLPFFIGFNHFYFLKDYRTAADYMLAAAALPGSPSYLKTLAARLAYYGGKSKTALLFLKEMLTESKDPLLKQRLQFRLKALEGASAIEDALDQYRKDHGDSPASLDDLVSSQYLQSLPEEPYGGRWVILKNGRVFSTSKFTKGKVKQ